jgi:hypothetical protein
MDTSPNLALPYIDAAQAQKHVTHNEAIRALDALVQLTVLDKDLATPPGSPADGNRYIVAASPTGAWAGQAGKIAAWQDGAWAFLTPREGWLTWVADEDKIYAYGGSAWAELAANPGGGAAVWGINATADTTNRLAVKSAASLFDNVGNGHQQKINKNAAGDTASTLYQTNYSGRAEFGLAGDDNFHVKVSADGSTWKEALVVDRSTGAVRLPLTSQIAPPQGRLTLVSGTPVITTDQTAKTTIYYTPHVGSLAPVWDGTTWALVLLAELSLGLDSNSGHTGYHQSGKNFDVFLDYNGGTPRLVTGPAWSSDTARASAIARQNGLWLNSASMTARFGTGSGDTVTIAASRATYLGTFRASADGQTQLKLGGTAAGGDKGSYLLWNAWNRHETVAVVKDSTANWTDSSGAAYHAFNPGGSGSGLNNRVEFVRGLDEDAVDAWLKCNMQSGAGGAGAPAIMAVGYDWTSGGPDGFKSYWESTIIGTFESQNARLGGLGFHYMQAVNFGAAASGPTYYGNGNSALHCQLRY